MAIAAAGDLAVGGYSWCFICCGTILFVAGIGPVSGISFAALELSSIADNGCVGVFGFWAGARYLDLGWRCGHDSSVFWRNTHAGHVGFVAAGIGGKLMRTEGLLAAASSPASSDLPCVLVADEDPRTADMVATVLGPDYDIVSVIAVSEAMELAHQRRIRVALISGSLPDAQGYALCRRLRAQPGHTSLPILVATNGNDPRTIGRAMDAGATAFLMRPLQPKILRNRLSRLATAQVEQDWDLLNPVQRSTLRLSHRAFSRLTASVISGEMLPREDIEESSRTLVEAAKGGHISAILAAVRDHDNYTFVHSLRVAAHMTLFGVSVGLRDGDLQALAEAGLLHDIGKLRIPTAILNKPGPLTSSEWEVMRGHVDTSVSILAEASQLRAEVLNVAARHHERLDGSGYPHGLKGRQLDEPSLVSAVVDIYTALTDRRSYKPAFTPAQSMAELRAYAPGRLELGYLHRFGEMILDQQAKKSGV